MRRKRIKCHGGVFFSQQDGGLQISNDPPPQEQFDWAQGRGGHQAGDEDLQDEKEGHKL